MRAPAEERCSFGCGWNASLPRCCRPGSGICRSPLLSCLMLRVLRATLRGPAGPLPQVHPDKWYPSVGTWPVAVGDSAEREQTNGEGMRKDAP